MVRKSVLRNVKIIKELQRINGVVGSIQGNLENVAIGLGKKNEYAAHLLMQASELKMIRDLNLTIIALMTGEDVELEHEREILEKKAKIYLDASLRSLAEA